MHPPSSGSGSGPQLISLHHTLCHASGLAVPPLLPLISPHPCPSKAQCPCLLIFLERKQAWEGMKGCSDEFSGPPMVPDPTFCHWPHSLHVQS